ncbi:MAG: cardiolipin synthase [Coriobacteriia bacterium]|nr:cardiolipin synthase [Coriobacteriia bacterium]
MITARIATVYPVTAAVLVVLYYIVSYLVLISDDSEPAEQFAWMFFVWAFPFIGLTMYFIFGRDWRKKGQNRTQMYEREFLPMMRPIYDAYEPAVEHFRKAEASAVQLKVVEAIKSLNLASPLPVRDIQLFSSGGGFFEAMCADMEKAQHFIHHQYFIWENDELTAKMKDIMLDRLANGVEVRIVYDWMGSLPFKKNEMKELKAAGALIFEDMKHLDSLNYRNHRKITVIDSEIGYNGGFNVGQEYIDGGKAYPTWRDSGLRYTGPGVAELQKWFAARWFVLHNKENLLTEKYLPAVDSSLNEGEPAIIQVVAQAAEDPYGSAALVHMVAMGAAEKTLRIQSPYFVPDAPMLDAMVGAALAGVDVQFMMTGMPDHKTAWLAARTYYPKLLDAGARIFRYDAGFFHAKTISVDGKYCAVGTMNMDRRSFDLQKEMMTWVHNGDTARQLEAQFEIDKTKCTEVTQAEIDSYTFTDKLQQRTFRLMSHIL